MCGKHEKGSGSESRPQFSEPGRVTWSLSFGFCIRQMKITTLFLHERLLPVAFRAHQLHILISKYFMYDIHYNSFFFNYLRDQPGIVDPKFHSFQRWWKYLVLLYKELHGVKAPKEVNISSLERRLCEFKAIDLGKSSHQFLREENTRLRQRTHQICFNMCFICDARIYVSSVILNTTSAGFMKTLFPGPSHNVKM